MSNIRTIVRGAYDIQKLRIQTGNRITANFKAKLGQSPGEREIEIGDEGKVLIAALRKEYARITDGIVGLPRFKNFKGDELITDYTELVLIDQYLDLEASEKKHFKHLKSTLREYPIYTNWLDSVLGVGAAMSGVIVSEIDIHKARYPSSLWAYAGLDVAQDGQGRSRRKEHQVDVEYTDKNGEVTTRKGITFNPFLKTKMMGVLGPSFVKQDREKSLYRQIYDAYKNRISNHPAHQDKTKLHLNNMAIRYTVKRFLCDLYVQWRTLEGLPVAAEYSEGKLGIVHSK